MILMVMSKIWNDSHDHKINGYENTVKLFSFLTNYGNENWEIILTTIKNYGAENSQNFAHDHI